MNNSTFNNWDDGSLWTSPTEEETGQPVRIAASTSLLYHQAEQILQIIFGTTSYAPLCTSQIKASTFPPGNTPGI